MPTALAKQTTRTHAHARKHAHTHARTHTHMSVTPRTCALQASAGVLEVCEVHSCANMVRTLQSAAAAGWRVLGAVADARAEKSRDVSVEQPTVLVMGAWFCEEAEEDGCLRCGAA